MEKRWPACLWLNTLRGAENRAVVGHAPSQVKLLPDMENQCVAGPTIFRFLATLFAIASSGPAPFGAKIQRWVDRRDRLALDCQIPPRNGRKRVIPASPS